MANPSWSPNGTVAPYGVIIDSNGNVQQAGAAGGIMGLNEPNPWGDNVGDDTDDGTVEWTCVAVVAAPAPAIAGLPSTPPLFVTDSDGLNVNSIVTDMIAQFEAITGRTLQPAQVERLYINFSAYRESLVREAIQFCGQQCLLAFAIYPVLDYLAELVGVTRLPSQPATTVIQFVLANVLTVPFMIPAGTPVGSDDGEVVFLTDEALTIPAGSANGTVSATCQAPGAAGNGYFAGQINVMLAPNALIQSAANTVQSNGGSDPETDDHLRTRIQAAPSRFSVAGPAGAYRFFALGVDPSIVDVQVVTPVPGTVQVFVLIGPAAQPAASPNPNGIAGSGILDEVAAALSGDDVRPLCDTVEVSAVTEIDYEINATCTMFANADPTTVEAAANQAAALYASNLAARIQRDIVPEEIIAALMVPGMYRVVIDDPSYTELSEGQWANCTAINLTFETAAENM